MHVMMAEAGGTKVMHQYFCTISIRSDDGPKKVKPNPCHSTPLGQSTSNLITIINTAGHY